MYVGASRDERACMHVVLNIWCMDSRFFFFFEILETSADSPSYMLSSHINIVLVICSGRKYSDNIGLSVLHHSIISGHQNCFIQLLFHPLIKHGPNYGD